MCAGFVWTLFLVNVTCKIEMRLGFLAVLLLDLIQFVYLFIYLFQLVYHLSPKGHRAVLLLLPISSTNSTAFFSPEEDAKKRPSILGAIHGPYSIQLLELIF